MPQLLLVSKAKKPRDETAAATVFLPILALLAAQLITASWHVLGKHVLRQVPYLDPISFVLFRTLVAYVALFLVGDSRGMFHFRRCIAMETTTYGNKNLLTLNHHRQ